jgi:hypothetical protein
LAILLIIATPFTLVRLGWHEFVVDVKGSLDFTQNLRHSASEAVVFTPASTSVEIRRALWAKPFEGWWISKKLPVQIQFDRGGWWLSKDEQSPDRAIILVLRPNPPALSTSDGVLHSQLTFRNTDTGQVFDTREATLQLAAGPLARLSLGGHDAIIFTGFKGGPFNPQSAQISLSASGGDIRWSAHDVPSWISLTGDTAGKIKKDNSITLTVVPQAANLLPGPYEGQLTFRYDEADSILQEPVRLVVLDAALECDKRTGDRFDPDHPSSAPFVTSTGTLSEDDIDQATRACAAAFQGESSTTNRRFMAQMGRAYAARAVRLAKSRADPEARAAMSDAVRLWQEGAAKGSTAAMTYLGYYWAALFDDEVDPPSTNKCRSAQPRFSFVTADMRTARDFWARAAKASPPNAEAMSKYGRLLVIAPDFCPPRPDLQNIPEGISWLKKAVDRGNADAAEVLGELFYRGRTPTPTTPDDKFAKNIDEGLRWLTIACRDSNVRAKDLVTTMISTTREMDPAKRPPGC